jgi:hypothetical protein
VCPDLRISEWDGLGSKFGVLELLLELPPAGSNSRGAAPWKEKIDCFSSPTANTVRNTPSRAPAPT